MPQRAKTLIAFATAWGPKFGGINCFNADLLEAAAAAFFIDLRIVCVVLHATPAEVEDAQRNQVTLVGLGLEGQSRFGSELEPLAWARLQAALGAWETADTVWLGHDRVTGAITIEAAQTRGGRSALIHHMSYERYEDFAENSATACGKEAEQKSLFSKAAHVMAVGPLLQEALADMLNKAVPCLIPGLAEIEQRSAPNKFKAFLGGRLHADARKIKQAHLGLAGFGHAVHLCDQDSAYPNALKGENEPAMLLRGVDFDHTDGLTPAEAEQEVRLFVAGYARRVVSLKLLPFTQDRRTLFEELRSASVAMMPSWHEGFGLVAWEAIAAGVPLIVSSKSGVYKFLNQVQAGLYKGFVQAVDVQGASVEPYFTEIDKTTVAQTLIDVAKDAGAWRQKSQQLREGLSLHYTWTHCAQQFVEAIGWRLQTPTRRGAGSAAAEPDKELPMHPVNNAVPGSAASSGSSLAAWLETPLPTWKAAQGRSISQLLRAEEAVVPFDPQRQPFLDEQFAWATAPKHPLALRLLTGQGGTGKTRLALELCGQLNREGWQTGFLRSECDARSMTELAKKLVSTSQGGQAICVVVDYAETRQGALLKLLTDLQALPGPVPIRILLLARDGGEWWAQLPDQQRECESLLLGEATSGPYPLPPLHDDEASRQAAYQTALRAFAQQLGMVLPMGLHALEGDHFAHPLYLQMAALMALHGEKPQSAQGLARAIVSHESRYWRSATQHLASTNHVADGAMLMTLATLASGFATVREVERAWELAGGTRAVLKPLWSALCPLYPGRQGLQGLRPDLVGEALVAQSILGATGDEVLSAVLGSGVSALRQSCLTVLARLLRQRVDVAPVVQSVLTNHFAACVQDLLQVCIATPSPLAELAAASFRVLSRATQHQLAGLMAPMFRHELLPLTSLAVAVGEARCEKCRPKHGDTHNSLDKQADWGRAIGELAVDYLRNGATAQALDTGKEAQNVFARLIRRDMRFEPDYAMSLGNHATILSENGREQEALVCAKQALDIRQRLAQNKPERFEPDYAASLDSHATILAENGHEQEALVCSKQALDIYQRLAQHKPELSEPDYAGSLGNHARILHENGREQEALVCSKQALDIYQRLAQHKPERFEPDYAACLNNHANALSENGREQEALVCAKQALDIRQRLAQNKPERFEPDYARSLGNHASILSENGREQEALVCGKQALDIHQRLAQHKPERFEPDYAACLNNHANALSENGREQEALVCAKQALDIHQRLAQNKPERFEPDYARSLGNHVSILSENGSEQEALVYAKQALDIHQRLAQNKPERFEPDYARSLGNHASILSENGSEQAALVCGKQALDIYQRLAQNKPERFEPDYARSLNNHANILAENGREQEALVYGKQALDIRQRLAQEKPERFEPHYASSLNNYANRLSENGREQEALVYGKQALDIRQRLAQNKPERFEPHYASSLNNYANRLSENGREQEALVCAKEALDIHQRLAQNKPERFESDYATSLSNYANLLSENGSEQEALVCAKQALDIRQRLAQNKPERFEPDYAMSLSNYAQSLSAQGKYIEAVTQEVLSHSLYAQHTRRMPLRYAGDEYQARLFLALWRWLDCGQAMEGELGPDVPDLNARAQREAHFQRAVLQCLDAAFNQASTEGRRSRVEAALVHWGRLDASQQHSWRIMYLLVAALAHHKLGVDSAPAGWLEQLERFRQRREGHMPQWMLDAATRCDFLLGL